MNINDKLPDFSLKGTDHKFHGPGEYADKEVVVILFTCNHCPYARAYIKRIAELVTTYEPKNVGFFAINPNDVVNYPEDSFDNMIPMAVELKLPGKYLYDEQQHVAHTFGAQKTPEVFIFNKKRELVYKGAIDDNYEIAEAVEKKYLRATMDALLEGSPIEIQETPAVGCSVKWKQN